jgi:GGDEF domain-containing protein
MVTREPDQVVAMRVPLVHVAVIDHVAKELGVSRSELIRRVLADWIAQRVEDPDSKVDLPPTVTLVDIAVLTKLNDMYEHAMARQQFIDELRAHLDEFSFATREAIECDRQGGTP